MPALTQEPSFLEYIFAPLFHTHPFDSWVKAEEAALNRQTDEELQQHMTTYDVNAWRALNILTERNNKRIEAERGD